MAGEVPFSAGAAAIAAGVAALAAGVTVSAAGVAVVVWPGVSIGAVVGTAVVVTVAVSFWIGGDLLASGALSLNP